MKTLTDIFSLPEGSVLISYPSQIDQDSIKDVVDWAVFGEQEDRAAQSTTATTGERP